VEEEFCPSTLSNADLLDAIAFIHGAILDSPDEVRRALDLDRIFGELSRELLNRGLTKTVVSSGAQDPLGPPLLDEKSQAFGSTLDCTTGVVR
jgi:hypothetical protein